MSDNNPYQQGLDATQKSNNGAGATGPDWTFARLPVPEMAKGSRNEATFRFLPRFEFDDNGVLLLDRPLPQFWVTAAQHQYAVDGKRKSINCWDAGRSEGEPVTCPICLAQEELIAEQRARGGKKSADQTFWDAAMAMKVRKRFYATVVEMDNPGVHWVQTGSDYQIAAHVLGYGNTIQRALMELCIAKGGIENHGPSGRDIKIIGNRTGSEKFDVEYRVVDSDPGPLRDDLLVVLENTIDISSLGKKAAEEQVNDYLARMDPRAKGQAAAQRGDAPPSAPSAPERWQPLTPDHPAWTVSHNGQNYPGLTSAQVKQMVATNGPVYVWKDGMANWAASNTIPELA